MPRLRVVAGPSLDALVPISVNSDLPQNIVSDAFEGQIAAYIKGFPDEQGNALQSEYFNREDRKGVTWSIQVQGRFLRPISADDVLFGNTFDRPLKLPWGSGAALKFMHFVDPTLEHDLASSTKPWALSPLISTMPYFAHRRAWPSFPPPQSLSDDTAQLHLTLRTPEPSHSPSPSPLSSRHASPESWFEPQAPGNASSTLQPPKSHVGDKHLSKKHKRLSAASLASRLSAHHEGRLARSERKRTETFAKQEQELQELRNAARRRAKLTFGPEDILTTDFCYGFIQFTPTVSLNLPGGITFDLMQYWDGQPVRFVCCERKRDDVGDGGAEGTDTDTDVPWGRVFWCVSIELIPDEPSQPQQPPQQATNDDAEHQTSVT
ncbi:DUF1769-domain-containing protein [Russula earlei]|uniref:DUF1769-domain-containing protein n=1 Tax=Russula earlei TaxID=71964 RepID=A0ACC0UBH2_9AGAM|nr:DUF1769-domain-containing protein [Russula earlei]